MPIQKEILPTIMVTFIPKRSPLFDYSKPVDGSNPETDWNGLHSVEENILIVNPETGWIQNCNSTPFTAADFEQPKTRKLSNLHDFLSRKL